MASKYSSSNSTNRRSTISSNNISPSDSLEKMIYDLKPKLLEKGYTEKTVDDALEEYYEETKYQFSDEEIEEIISNGSDSLMEDVELYLEYRE